MSKQQQVAGAVASALDDLLTDQPWYRRYSNTITAACASLVTLGTWVTTTMTGLPEWVAVAIGAVVMVASVLAQRATRNGVTPRSNAVLVEAVAPRVEYAAQQARKTAAEALDAQRSRIPDRIEGVLDQILAQVGKLTEKPAEAAVDVVAEARAAGFADYDPRYVGLSLEDAARTYLAALTAPRAAPDDGRHAR